MNKPLLCSLAIALAILLPISSDAQDLLPKQKALGQKEYSVVKVTSSSDPLYLLKTDSANVPFTAAGMQALKPEWIKSVSVLKDKPAVDQYGAKGKNGVVLIELKPEHQHAFFDIMKKQESATGKGVNINLDGGLGVALPVPLYLIKTQSGEVAVSKEEVSEINPEWIKSIEVLKDAAAEKKYKEQGKNGVILITFAPEKEQDVLRKLKKHH